MLDRHHVDSEGIWKSFINKARLWTGCCGRFTAGCGAISTGACASCSRSPKSKPTAGATSCAPPKSRRTRCCAGCTWNTRSTSCATPICSASAAPRSCNCAPTRSTALFDASPLPGGHGLDDLTIEGEPDHRLLAFLHVAEKAAAGRFAIYRDVVDDDPATRAIFEEILRDEVFHMNYTYTQLARISPQVVPAAGLAGAREPPVEAIPACRGGRGRRASATAILTIMYFVVLAAVRVAGEARRAARAGRLDADRARERSESPTSQY